MNGHASLLPFPGLAWGPYPQRRTVAGDPDRWTRLRRRAGGWLMLGRQLAGPWERQADRHFARAVLARARGHESCSKDELDSRLRGLRALLSRDGLQPAHLAAVLGLLVEYCRRTLDTTPFDTQLVAVRVLLRNRLAEVATGEGKTLAAGLAAAVAALAGIPVHVVTANDYLVERDRTMLRPLFDALGLPSAQVLPADAPAQRRAAYRSPIVYATARELAFDYLRDRLLLDRGEPELMAHLRGLSGQTDDAGGPLMQGLCMAILDEADSVLLDEACTPLVLSRPCSHPAPAQEYRQAHAIARQLWINRDFRLDPVYRQATLTAAGRRRVRETAQAQQHATIHARHREALVATALAALHHYRRDRDYLVIDGAITMIDQPTGRLAHGRVWSRGLQQMIELGEGLDPGPGTETAAQITYQQFFARYLRLCGMSGSLREARVELSCVYRQTVTPVPPRLPCRRRHLGQLVLDDAAGKWMAAARIAARASHCGRATLIAVDSVAHARQLSALLTRRGVRHQLLDALAHAEEAQIIARAGRSGVVTVATNMAGRGTDIVLDDAALACGARSRWCASSTVSGASTARCSGAALARASRAR
ncbi:MAG: hypothetical protein R3E68_01110 [Burkholderiaceae bacterium]